MSRGEAGKSAVLPPVGMGCLYARHLTLNLNKVYCMYPRYSLAPVV